MSRFGKENTLPSPQLEFTINPPAFILISLYVRRPTEGNIIRLDDLCSQIRSLSTDSLVEYARVPVRKCCYSFFKSVVRSD